MFRSVAMLCVMVLQMIDCSPADAGTVSVNFVANTSSLQYIGEDFPSVVADQGWDNILISSGITSFSNLDGSTLDVSVVSAGPSSGGTLWNGWAQRGGAYGNTVTVNISQIPYNEYYIVAYVSGWNTASGSVSCNGSTKFYDLAPIVSTGTAQLIESADVDGTDGYAAASYTVFGSENRSLTGDAITLTLTKLAGTVIFGGFQVVEITRDNDLTIFPSSYPAVPLSDDYTMCVDGQDVECYATWRYDDIQSVTNINGRPVSPLSFSMFDFSGPVNVKLYLTGGLLDTNTFQILPSSLNIQPTVTDDYLEFMLDAPGCVTIDPKGNGRNVLHLFTNLPETDVPGTNDANVTYYGPGLYDIDSLLINSAGHTVYLAPGAVVRPLPSVPSGTTCSSYGYTYTNMVPAFRTWKNNVTIRGRGIISGMRGVEALKRFNMIFSDSVSGMTVKDIIVMDSACWTTYFSKNENLLVDNVKILGFLPTTDATVLAGGSNLVVRNTFAHNADDGFEVKTWGQPALDILYENCQIWNDAGGPLGIFGEAGSDISNVVWSNITVLNYTPGLRDEDYDSRAVFVVHPIGGGTMSHIRFENIIIENSIGGRPLFHFGNEHLDWAGNPINTEDPYSSIRDITFANIKAYNISNDLCYLRDDSGSNLVSGVVMSNMVINGTLMTTVSDLNLTKVGTAADPEVRCPRVISGNFRASSAAVQSINTDKFSWVVADADWDEMDVAIGNTFAFMDVNFSSLEVAVDSTGASGATSAYDGYPQRGGLKQGSVVTFRHIPYDRYYLIIYLSGWAASAGGSVSCDGRTFYYSFGSVSSNATLLLTQDTDAGDGVDAGTYAKFGSAVNPLTSSSCTVDLSVIPGGQAPAILGGFQIVDIDAP